MTLRNLVLVGLALFMAGCGCLGSRSFHLQTDLVNDGNRLLALEGTSNLPEGSRLSATLKDAERLLGTNRTTLRQGRFLMTLDVSQAPGNVPLLLEVTFDPRSASAEIQDVVGAEGQWMLGDQVEDEGGAWRLVDRAHVILPMNRRDAAIRLVEGGSLVEGIVGLQSEVGQVTEDPEAAAWLALARMQRIPSERQAGSTSHRNLAKAAQVARLSGALGDEARLWLTRLGREEALLARRQTWARERRQAQASRERRRWLVEPGKAMAGVELGGEAARVLAEFKPDRIPDFSAGNAVVRLTDRQVDVELDAATRRVVRIFSTSERFRLPGDLGVGVPLLVFQERYPGLAVSFGPVQTAEDGSRTAHGEAVLEEGLVLRVERHVGRLGLNFDLVVGLGVVPPGAGGWR